jgi:two-component system, NarL family, nitrate/nitrite response regulator NarL
MNRSEAANRETAAVAPINLLLLDDHAMFRQGLARVLEKEPEFNVVGQFATSAEALDALGGSRATMVLLDVDLGPERALDFVLESRRRGFEGQILVVTAGVSGQEAVQLVRAGVVGILHKHHSTEMLCSTICRVAAGEVYLEKEYLDPLYRSADRTKTQDRPRLTERDKTVLRFIFQGLSNREIGARLDISESAVKSSLRQIFNKLGVRTRAQVVKIALEQYRDQL